MNTCPEAHAKAGKDRRRDGAEVMGRKGEETPGRSRGKEEALGRGWGVGSWARARPCGSRLAFCIPGLCTQGGEWVSCREGAGRHPPEHTKQRK